MKDMIETRTGYSDVDPVLHNFTKQCKRIFSDKMRSIYLLGSLAYGGFVSGWSDIDGIVILKCNVTATLNSKYRGIIENLEKAFPKWKGKLFIDQLLSEGELYSNNICFDDLGLVNLVSLLETGKLIYGEDIRPKIKPPPRKLLNKYMLKELIEKILEPRTERLPLTANISNNDAQFYRDNPSAIIAWLFYPARILYTLETGKIRSKEEAVKYYISNHEDEYIEFLSKGLKYRQKGITKIPEEEIWPFVRITSRFFWHYVNLLLKNYKAIGADQLPITESSFATQLLKQIL